MDSEDIRQSVARRSDKAVSLPNDVARCMGHGCDKRDSCLRYTSKGYWSPFAQFDPDNCEYHIEDNKNERICATDERRKD